MRVLYGKNFRSRYETVAAMIPEGASVIDVCCGDCYIYGFLKKKHVDYLGLDVQPGFVNHAVKKGIRAVTFDIKKTIPQPADYVLMQGSLYQFIPDHEDMMGRLFAAAKKAVIISEPVANIASCRNPLAKLLARLATRVGGNDFPDRFTKADLEKLFYGHGVGHIKEINGGRELIGVFNRGIK